MAKVLYTYEPKHDDELALPEVGALVTVLQKNTGDDGWYVNFDGEKHLRFDGELNGHRGLFPDNFVELLPVSLICWTNGHQLALPSRQHNAPNVKMPTCSSNQELAIDWLRPAPQYGFVRKLQCLFRIGQSRGSIRHSRRW